MRCLQVCASAILAIWLALAPVASWAGSMMLLGAGGSSGAVAGSTITPIIGNGPTAGPSSSIVNYIGLFQGIAGAAWSANNTLRAAKWPVAGTISNLYVRFPSGAGVGGQYYVSLVKNGTVSTNVTCNFTNSASAQTCTSAGSEAVVPTDTLQWQVCPGVGALSGTTCTAAAGQATNTVVQISATFTSTANNESFLLSSGSTSVATNANATYASFGGYNVYTATEAQFAMAMPTAGVIDQLYVNGPVAAPGASKTWTLTLWKNHAATSLACFMTGTGSGNGITFCQDTNTGHAVTVAAGDTISIENCPSTVSAGVCQASTTPAANLFTVAARFVPTKPGESVLTTAIYTGNVPGAATTRFFGTDSTANDNATETNAYGIAPVDMTIKKLNVALSPAPGAGSPSRTFTLMTGAPGSTAAVSPTCPITTGTTCTDATSASITATNAIDWRMTSANTPASLTALSIAAVATVP